jgi:hypothetical protein
MTEAEPPISEMSKHDTEPGVSHVDARGELGNVQCDGAYGCDFQSEEFGSPLSMQMVGRAGSRRDRRDVTRQIDQIQTLIAWRAVALHIARCAQHCAGPCARGPHCVAFDVHDSGQLFHSRRHARVRIADGTARVARAVHQRLSPGNRADRNGCRPGHQHHRRTQQTRHSAAHDQQSAGERGCCGGNARACVPISA